LTLRYDSYAALLAVANELKPEQLNGRSHEVRDEYFFASKDWAEAFGYASQGWPAGAAKAAEISQEIQDVLGHLIEQERISYDVEGATFDVARLCQGEPEHWATFTPTLVEGTGRRYVAITVSMGASCIVGADEIERRGAAISSLILLLERAGIRVQLTAGFYSEGARGHLLDVEVLLKGYGDSLDIDRMAFVLGHPSSLRRILFAIMESRNPTERAALHVGNGYGVVRDKADKAGIDLYLAAPQGGDSPWESVESATAWVKEQLEAQGAIVAQTV
jgi:hypothetical protein